MTAKIFKFNPGDKVRLTGKYLRNTGQYKGSEGMARWIVQACKAATPCRMCAGGVYILTNEPADTAGLTAEDLVQAPCARWRRINAANLEKC